MKKTKNPIAVQAGCDFFLRFATRIQLQNEENLDNMQGHKEQLTAISSLFVKNSFLRRDAISEYALKFITDDATILVHSYSRVVMQLLLKAAKANIRFQVLVTETRPSSSGKRAVDELKHNGIPATMILDSAVGYFIGKVDMVLVGAEGIAENGGLINQIGTYQIAVVSKAANKPFYVVTESHKFVKLFPLNQYDLHGSTPKTSVAPLRRKRSHHIDVDLING
ncbi:translation initiation factor eIF-2B subunit alpha, partial [Clydaea vesicula]